VAETINMDDQGNTGGNQGQEKCSQDIYIYFFKMFYQKNPTES